MNKAITMIQIDKEVMYKCEEKLKPKPKKKSQMASHTIGSKLLCFSFFFNALS